jgi:hypothetical protein
MKVFHGVIQSMLTRLIRSALVVLLTSVASASACDVPIPTRGSFVEWPTRFLVGKVEVLQVRTISMMERYARVRLIEPVRGELPREFGVLYDVTSCGGYFAKGKIKIAGFILLPPEEQTKHYRYMTNSLVGSWTQAIFIDRGAHLIE